MSYKGFSTALTFAACSFLSADALAAGSLLRVACEGNDSGAEITINGVFKGECPLDIQVNPGTVVLRVVKKIDVERERSFQQEFRMGDGVVKKVEAVLSAPQWTAEGLRRERERQAAQQAIAEAARRADQEALQRQTLGAEAGDAQAMLALADRYASGSGVQQDNDTATQWLRKAAGAGNEVAKFKLSDLYKQRRDDPDIQAVLRMLALPVDNPRDIVVDGHDAIRAFVATDPFFTASGSGQPITYTYAKSFMPSMRLFNTTTCARKGNIFPTTARTQANDISNTSEGEMLLGGILWLTGSTSHGFLRSTDTKLSRLEKFEGQPFPLTPGKRFGYTASFLSSGTYAGNGKSTTRMTCATTDVRVKSVGALQLPENAPQVICYHQIGIYEEITRHYWHEYSGCLVNVGTK